jgi:predicted O-methyltransferase YrrM
VSKLIPITLPVDIRPLPIAVENLLRDADQRIELFQQARSDTPVVGFVPSDFPTVYHSLAAVAELNLASGHRFLEWGSGVGVVTCLAAILGFDAVGIEIEAELDAIARALAEDHDIEVQFVCGSFVPDDAEALLDRQEDITWLRSDGASAYEELGLEPDDFDVIFAYPWPGEEQIVFNLFAKTAAVGALLVTYHGQEGVRVARKGRQRSKRGGMP